MGIKVVEKKYDDYDGAELPDDTEAWQVELQGTKWDLYLSAKNRKAVEETLDKLTQNAVRVKKGSGRTTKQLNEIRDWAKDNGFADRIRPTGTVPKDIIDAYDEAKQ